MKKISKLLCASVLCVSTFSLTSCNLTQGDESNEYRIVVGASPTPHAEILEQVKFALADQGYALDIREFNDYVIPNIAVEDNEIDANFFQHTTYLNKFNEDHNAELVSAGAIHYEPLALYSGSKNKLEDIANGDKILVPNDVTNEARALLLLQELELITLKESAGIYATKLDIVSNPYNLEIIERGAEQIANVREDAAFAFINGNYAIQAGLEINSALAIESNDGIVAEAYANIVVVKKGNENKPKIQALVKALQSDSVKQFINEKYKGSVVPLF